MKALKALKPSPASEPAAFAEADVSSMQALATGTANEGQQKRAFNWILESACGIGQWPYRDSARETDVALGRQFVGHQIVGLTRVNISRLRKREETQGA